MLNVEMTMDSLRLLILSPITSRDRGPRVSPYSPCHGVVVDRSSWSAQRWLKESSASPLHGLALPSGVTSL